MELEVDEMLVELIQNAAQKALERAVNEEKDIEEARFYQYRKQ